MAKRRTPGTGTVFWDERRKRWIARLVLPPDRDGKSKAWVRSAKLKREAEALLRAALDDQEKGRLVVGDKTTLAAYLELWLGTLEPTVEPKWFYDVQSYARRVIVPVLGGVTLQRLGIAEVQRLVAALERQGRSAYYVQKVLGVLKHALADAVSWQLIYQNPAQYVKVPKAEPKEKIIWTVEQTRTFLEAVQGDDDEALYIVAIYSGARPGELLALGWSDVDFERSTISLDRAVTRVPRVGIVVTDMKTRRSHRLVALPEPAMRALREQEARLRLWRAREGYTERGLVFPKRDGSYRTDEGPRQKLQRIAAELGLPAVTFYHLRHLSASLSLLLGADPKVIQARLGHSTIQVTLDVYSHLIGSQDRELAERLGSALNGKAKRGGSS